MYFDFASTTRMKEEVYQEMLPFLEYNFGNPSSLYDSGIQNRKVINTCRKKVAELLNCYPNEIYFTSGGSESNNWALKGTAFHKNKKEIITTKIEHHSILHTCEFLKRLGYVIHYLDVDSFGFIDLKQLEQLITKETLLVSVILANNEIGTIQSISKISKICRDKHVLLHVDAVQAIGHIDINLKEMGVDLLSLSAHKFYGPKGIGMLYIRKGVEIENLIHGGLQEYGRRGGTENVANIVGLTKALELALTNINEKNLYLQSLSKLIFNQLTLHIRDIKLNGPEIGEKRIPGHLNFSFKDLDGSDLCFELNKKGICVSTGSACQSGSIEPSHVIQALGVSDEYINGAIRITLGEETTVEEVEVLCEEIIKIVIK